MGLVVPFAKEITNNRVFKLKVNIKEISTPSGRRKDNLSKEVEDRLLREKHFWIEDFYSTYQNEHEKNKRRYVSQWTAEEKSGKIWVRGLKKDSKLALEIWIGGSALTWLTSLAFYRFTLSCNQVRALFLQDGLGNDTQEGREAQFDRFMMVCSRGSIFDTEILADTH